MPLCMSLLADLYGPEERTAATGMLATVPTRRALLAVLRSPCSASNPSWRLLLLAPLG